MANYTNPRKCSWRRNTIRAICPWIVPRIKSGIHSEKGSAQPNFKGVGPATLSSVKILFLDRKFHFYWANFTLNTGLTVFPLLNSALLTDGGRRGLEETVRWSVSAFAKSTRAHFKPSATRVSVSASQGLTADRPDGPPGSLHGASGRQERTSSKFWLTRVSQF